MHATALRGTDTEFLIKARKVEPVKDVIDKLEAWNVVWVIIQDYEIDDLSNEKHNFILLSTKRAPLQREHGRRKEEVRA